MAMAEMPGPYDVRQYACRSRGVVTTPARWRRIRGVSRPVITFTLERLMDKAAAALKIDPIDIRRRNLIDKFPYTSAMGLVFDEATYKEDAGACGRAHRRTGVPHAAAGSAGQRPLLGWASRPSPSAPAMAARRLRRVAWRLRRAGRNVELTIDPVGLCRAAHRLFAARPGAFAPRWRKIVADEIGVEPSRIKVIHATRTARLMAGAPSRAGRW